MGHETNASMEREIINTIVIYKIHDLKNLTEVM